eukprot:79294-Amphidinium_carterae.1
MDLESEAVFRERAIKFGLSEEDYAILKNANFRSLGGFAYCCSYAPGGNDDSSFVNLVKRLFGEQVPEGTMANLRRLFFESYTASAVDTSRRYTRTEDDKPKKLPLAERADRAQRQARRLEGLSIQGFSEPSHTLVDLACHMYTENVCFHIDWHKCTMREQEVMQDKKVHSLLTLDSSGNLRPAPQDESRADVSTDLHAYMALRRRGLALDQANVCSHAAHDKWCDELFAHRLREGLGHSNKPSLDQLRAADVTLWQRIAEYTSSGIQVTTDGKQPVAVAMAELSQHPSVQFHLLPRSSPPLGAPASSSQTAQSAIARTAKSKSAAKRTHSNDLPRSKRVPLPKGLEAYEAPYIVQLFARDAGLSAALHNLGLESLAIDLDCVAEHKSPIVKLDLLSDAGWKLLNTFFEDRCPSHIHIALPWNSWSGRSTPLGRRLRSTSHPWGCPDLNAQDQKDVLTANYLAENVGRLVTTWMGRSTVVIEHPVSSLLWWIFPFAEWYRTMNNVVIDLCMFGHPSKLSRRWLTNAFSLTSLSSTCDGSHLHYAPDLAQAHQHPPRLALVVAQLLVQLYPARSSHRHSTLAVATGKQPRHRRWTLQVPEFLSTITCTTCDLPPLDHRQCLTVSFHHVPAGSKLIQVGGESEFDESKHRESAKKVYTFGIFRSPSQFVDFALKCQHPLDMHTGLQSTTLAAIAKYLASEPDEIIRSRSMAIRTWSDRASKNREREAELRKGMDADVAAVLGAKRLCLWKDMATEAGYTDPDVIDDMCRGFRVHGIAPFSKAFPEEQRIPAYTVEDLQSKAKWLTPALVGRVRRSDDEELDQEVWSETIEECSRHWLRGPMTLDGLRRDVGEHDVVVSRRFGLRQGLKTRLIDDYTESGVNGSYGCHNKVELGGVDEVLAIARCLALPFVAASNMWATADDGERFLLKPSAGWRRLHASKGLRMVGKTFDLKSAYRQLAVSPESNWCANLAVYSPEAKDVRFFRQLAGPFGSAAMVLSFNRTAKCLQSTFATLLSLPWSNYFDDFPTVEFDATSNSAEVAVRAMFQLTAWDYAQDARKCKPYGSAFDALGVSFDLTTALEGVIRVANKHSRKQELSDVIEGILATESLSQGQAASLRGKFQFAEAQTFAGVGRWPRQELSARADGRDKGVKVTTPVREALCLLKDILMNARPRELWVYDPRAPVLLFTDGAFEQGCCGVGGVMFDPQEPEAAEFFSESVPENTVKAWLQEGCVHPVCRAEVVPLVAARVLWREKLRNRRVLAFLDSNAVLHAAVKGMSNDSFLKTSLKRLCLEQLACPSLFWYCRVPTFSNPADAPSRGLSSRVLGVRPCSRVVAAEQVQWAASVDE